jgi:hypothetical protein
MQIKLRAIGANQTIVEVGRHIYYFSYDTCIAVEVEDYMGKCHRVRRARNYSKTTTKHMTQFGVKDWEQISDAEFEKLAAIGK